MGKIKMLVNNKNNNYIKVVVKWQKKQLTKYLF